MPSGIVVFDARLRLDEHIIIRPFTDFITCSFMSGDKKVADASQILRSFAIARFYPPEVSNIIRKEREGTAILPSIGGGRIIDPNRPGNLPATGIAWLPGQNSTLQGYPLIPKFRDQVAEEVFIHFCGGRRVFHPGLLNVPKFDDWKVSGARASQTALRSSL